MARITEFSHLPTVPGWGAYDWQQMLGYSSEAEGPIVRLSQLYKIHDMWTNSDEATYSEADYAALIELWDGSWATLHAGCDASGWACHGSDVRWRIFSTRNQAVRDGLTNESRRWLQLDLPEPDEATGDQ